MNCPKCGSSKGNATVTIVGDWPGGETRVVPSPGDIHANVCQTCGHTFDQRVHGAPERSPKTPWLDVQHHRSSVSMEYTGPGSCEAVEP